jgi:prepilin-type N-terminal cleavage/methylation domain-containing protein
MNFPMLSSRSSRSGMTLIEVTIAITLVALLMAGMMLAMRISLTSLGKANDKMIANRRVTGAQRILEQQIAGLMPVAAITPNTGTGLAGLRVLFFQGESQSMRFVSTYSLHDASRGTPHILEFQVVPGGDNGGVRLVVNELPYANPFSAGEIVLGRTVVDGGLLNSFRPIEIGPQSFVLADKLATCRFLYQEPRPRPEYQRWVELWIKQDWPTSIRIEMTPLRDEPGQLKMTTVTAPIRVNKAPLETYEDK